MDARRPLRFSPSSARSLASICLLAAWAGIAPLTAPSAAWGQASADWPQFLGPNRNGISQEKGLLETWPNGGPKIAWRVKGGVGMSGIAVRGRHAVTMVQSAGKQWLLALQADSGTELWRTELAPEYRNSMGNGPRATPALTTTQALAFTGEGILVAVNLADGKKQWSRNVVEELGGKAAEYGMASSPLVVGENVLVLVGAPNASVAAYSLKTGQLAWKGGSDPAGYSSPTLLELAGRTQVVVATGVSILGLDPTRGEQLWRFPFETDFYCNTATPVAVADGLFVSSGENHGCVLLGLEQAGKKLTVDERWTSLGPKSVLRSEWQTSIAIDGYLYGMDNVGAAGPVTHLTCVKGATGERVWQKQRFGKGNLIAADGKLFCSTMEGELVVVRATPKGYEELGRMSVLGPTRQSAALAQGRLFLRDDAEVVCVDVRK
jgi:outer membrane protein assembly factor BamB